MTIYADLPFDHAGGDGGFRSMTQMVVMHSTDNTASDENEASYAEDRPDHTSAHFYNDDDSVIQALDTSHIAYGCFPIGNSRSVQFEMTGRSNSISDATMRRVAPIVARVCRDYGIPIRKINATDLRNGVKGICGHADVTAAWGQGDHTDPGFAFHWDTFIGYVADASNPTPVRRHAEEEEMFSVPKVKALDSAGAWVDQSAAVPVPLFAVGTGAGQWGPAWVKLLSNGTAKVRVVTNGGGWTGTTVNLAFGGDALVPLPAGTTAVYVGRVDGDPLTADVNATVRYDN